jgi:hypothetical protein
MLVHDVELGAVARRERHRLAVLGSQPADELRVLGRADVEQLAELHGSAVVRGADEDEMHQKCVTGTRVTATSAKAASAR